MTRSRNKACTRFCAKTVEGSAAVFVARAMFFGNVSRSFAVHRYWRGVERNYWKRVVRKRMNAVITRESKSATDSTIKAGQLNEICGVRATLAR